MTLFFVSSLWTVLQASDLKRFCLSTHLWLLLPHSPPVTSDCLALPSLLTVTFVPFLSFLLEKDLPAQGRTPLHQQCIGVRIVRLWCVFPPALLRGCPPLSQALRVCVCVRGGYVCAALFCAGYVIVSVSQPWLHVRIVWAASKNPGAQATLQNN